MVVGGLVALVACIGMWMWPEAHDFTASRSVGEQNQGSTSTVPRLYPPAWHLPYKPPRVVFAAGSGKKAKVVSRVTPLMRAAARGSVDAVQRMLQRVPESEQATVRVLQLPPRRC